MDTNTTNAAVKAADVEAFLIAQAQSLSDQFPKQNIYVGIGTSRWPFDIPASDRKWCRWSVSIGTSDSVGSQDLAEAIRLASDAHSPAGQIQSKLDAIDKLRAEIRELSGPQESVVE